MINFNPCIYRNYETRDLSSSPNVWEGQRIVQKEQRVQAFCLSASKVSILKIRPKTGIYFLYLALELLQLPYRIFLFWLEGTTRVKIMRQITTWLSLGAICLPWENPGRGSLSEHMDSGQFVSLYADNPLCKYHFSSLVRLGRWAYRT